MRPWSAGTSPQSLYNQDLVTFEEDSGGYDQRDADGFIRLNALRLRIAAERELRLTAGKRKLESEWRPEPESNRRARICSPLRNHSAIGPRRGHVPDIAPAVKRRPAIRIRPMAVGAVRKLSIRAALHPRCISGI